MRNGMSSSLCFMSLLVGATGTDVAREIPDPVSERIQVVGVDRQARGHCPLHGGCSNDPPGCLPGCEGCDKKKTRRAMQSAVLWQR